MKKIYEHPAMDAVEIQFRSILMASDKGIPGNPEFPFPAPGRVF